MKIQRGKILRDASLGAGIVSSEGKNFEFDLVRCWHGDTPPRVDMVVELILSSEDEIQILKPVDTAILGKEQAEKIAMEAQQLASKGLDQSRVLGRKITQITGMSTLVLLLAIAACWFLLPAMEISFMGWSNSKDLSFTEFTRILNADEDSFLQRYSRRDSGGLWFVFLLCSLAAVPLTALLKPRMLKIVGALPLLLMISSAIVFYFRVRAFVDEAHDRLGNFAFGGRSMQDALDRMMERVMDSYSFSYGFYIGLLLCIALCVISIRKNQSTTDL